MADPGFDPARRGLWRQLSGGKTPQRPPWALAEPAFVDACSRCQDCIKACPEAILVVGDGGLPTVDFQRGGCTFCQACVTVCDSGALQLSASPWALRAVITDSCLTRSGVMCRSCEDSCEPRALRFVPRLGGVASPQIDPAICTGCGGCVAPCPVAAISLRADT